MMPIVYRREALIASADEHEISWREDRGNELVVIADEQIDRP